ncbi:beta-microseminoprotein [Astyanax mexicanus]|uniref:Beta-microseminoprotein n=2 Tax=Astyanax mexicanus TaxID=7994 RepID=A0A8B9RE60_ASTMX|nr:beta-microseminoprotein [Astyanax mexicanus]
MLKRSAVLVLGLCALVPLVYGACYRSLPEFGATECIDETDQTAHEVGSSWTNSKCIDCNCEPDGMTCCDGLPSITGYDEDCTVEYDYENCTFDVFKKDDRSEKCEFQAVL